MAVKKLKQRFKKALFAFFKDEILSSVGYMGEVSTYKYNTRDIRFTEIKSEIMFDERSEQRYNKPIGHIYEMALDEARKRLFEESMKYIQIDERSVMDRGIYNHRAIRISLLIGNKR